jgi:hypothetical protein
MLKMTGDTPPVQSTRLASTGILPTRAFPSQPHSSSSQAKVATYLRVENMITEPWGPHSVIIRTVVFHVMKISSRARRFRRNVMPLASGMKYVPTDQRRSQYKSSSTSRDSFHCGVCIKRTNKHQSNTTYIWYNFNKLTPCSKIPPEKLTGPHLIRIFPTFYGTRSFIDKSTRHRHLSMYWDRLIQSMPPFNFLKIYFNNILPPTPSYFKQ